MNTPNELSEDDYYSRDCTRFNCKCPEFAATGECQFYGVDCTKYICKCPDFATTGVCRKFSKNPYTKKKTKHIPTEDEQKEVLDELLNAWIDRKELCAYECKFIKAMSIRLRTGK